MDGQGQVRGSDKPEARRRSSREGGTAARQRDLRAAVREIIEPLCADLAAAPPQAPPAVVPDAAPSPPSPPRGSGSPLRAAIAASLADAVAQPVDEPAVFAQVLRLPLPGAAHLDEDEPEARQPAATPAAPPVDMAAAVGEWVAPLVDEVSRLRRELAEFRAADHEAQRGRGADMVRLLVGIFVCFLLVAAALVIVFKG